ncbi:hypothetical protein P879_02328 [Paragonimus westermani]|uniref:DUF5736 domain-containing protein n=1 Tax=Paragonimus westermani TaxID=34504 RepID=A0A8T0DRL3_9TREM|nr:hypothetical protein P879_02328 [Paragonimus westermani]
MQLQESAYEDLVKNEAQQGDQVKRRPFKTNISRLNNIVSMYIPSTSTERETEKQSDEHVKLLSTEGQKMEFNVVKYEELYDIKLLHNGDSLMRSIADALSTPLTNSSGKPRNVTSVAADQYTIYVGIEELPYVFLLKTTNDKPETNKNDLETGNDSNSIKGYIQLYVPRVGDLVPQEICVYSPSPESTIMYIVGWVKVVTDDVTCGTEKRWLLAKFSLTGQHIARTPVYSYQRYSGLAVDTSDGKLLLACPQLSLPETGVKTEGTEPTEVMTAGQLCKLTPGFERRVFSVTMGNDLANYRPDFVAQESAGRCCWASVQRASRTEMAKDGDTERPKIGRRLFAFPGRQIGYEGKRSPREWLHVASWDFAELNPGRIAAFDASRLLVVDASSGTLSYITWPDGQDKPTLHRITRPGSKPISLVCSTYHATDNEQNRPPPTAYFVAGTSIYSFLFRDIDPE